MATPARGRFDEAAAPGILIRVADDLLWRHLRDLPAFRALLRATEARLYADLPFPEPVLDLGCGDGHFGSVALARRPQVGLDPCLKLVREAARRRAYRWVIGADGAHIPFADRFFGTVVSNSVLEHIPSLEPVVAEVARVLRPGGHFYFCVPGPNFLSFLSLGRWLDQLHLRPLAEAYRRFFHRISRHYNYDSPETWRGRLEAAGLRLVRWCPYFSQRALAALEWGHYLGVASWVARRLTGRWVLCPSRASLWLTERLVRPFYREPLPEEGAYLFLVAQRLTGDGRG